LGTTAAGTSITAGATLDLNGYTLGTSEALTINGYGVGSNGALINSSSSIAATYSGAITVGSASYIGGAGSITLTGAVGSASYGVAFVLAGTSTTVATEGSGYAILLGQLGTTDPIRLASFNNGLQGTLNNIITF
jgi:hypothetical protein